MILRYFDFSTYYINKPIYSKQGDQHTCIIFMGQIMMNIMSTRDEQFRDVGFLPPGWFLSAGSIQG